MLELRGQGSGGWHFCLTSVPSGPCHFRKSPPLFVNWDWPRSGILRLTLSCRSLLPGHLLGESGLEADRARPGAPPLSDLVPCCDPKQPKELKAQASPSKSPPSASLMTLHVLPQPRQRPPGDLPSPWPFPTRSGLEGGPRKEQGADGCIHRLA